MFIDEAVASERVIVMFMKVSVYTQHEYQQMAQLRGTRLLTEKCNRVVVDLLVVTFELKQKVNSVKAGIWQCYFLVPFL